ncbi:hypothetical protein B0A49_08457 [Cryomyces minteri]|uniref:SET domain-containing protein n=1 Tax=Cryomyces minteri TaxID=331657 RepID=A0A4U0WUN4_9PEZI|nr:hypothetical protein B0A49_08457 [Cryomyces minteri]
MVRNRSQPVSNSNRVPKNWPRDVAYLAVPSYSKAVTTELLQSLNVAPSTSINPLSSTLLKSPSPIIHITPIENNAHPANGQYGLFAAQHLPPSSFITLYLGRVHTSAACDTDPASNYDLCLDRELGIGIDATHCGNEARFINDYRGIKAAGPNAEFRDVWVDVGNGKLERRIGVFVLGAGRSGRRVKGISKGEEVLVSYGKGFWGERRREEESGGGEEALVSWDTGNGNIEEVLGPPTGALEM